MTAPRIVTGAPVCPACSRERGTEDTECPYCGVVFSRFRPRLDASALEEIQTPAGHVHVGMKHRERLFSSAARSLEAGLSIQQFLHGPALGALPASVGDRLREDFDRTQTLSGAFAGIIDDADAAVLEAGETQGKLPSTLRALASRCAASIAARRRSLLATLYPAFLIVSASVITPLPRIFTDGLASYLIAALPGVVCVIGFYVLFLVVVPRTNPRTAQRLTHTIAIIPPLSTIARARAVATFARTLADGVSAGLPIRLALQLAARATGHPKVDSARLVEALDAGQSLGEALRSCGLFSAEDLAMVAHGEEVGRLDEVLPRIAEEQTRRARALTITVIVVMSVVVLTTVVVVIAMSVIDGFTSYLRTLETTVDGFML